MKNQSSLLSAYLIGQYIGELKLKINDADPQETERKPLKLHFVIDKLIGILSELEKLDATQHTQDEITSYLDSVEEKHGGLSAKIKQDGMLLSRLKNKIRAKTFERIKLSKDETINFDKMFTLWEDRITIFLSNQQILQPIAQLNINSSKLLEGPQTFLPDTWAELSPNQRNDLSQAAKSLLVGSWVPSVLAISRVFNEAIQTYVTQFTDLDPQNTEIETILAYLESNSKTDSELLDDITYLDETSRKAQDPGTNFTVYDAEQIFLKTIKLLQMIY
ncbi:MAG: hypothetical protein ACXAB7_08735 [Candidatus Kariarchaeaceae archaeon]